MVVKCHPGLGVDMYARSEQSQAAGDTHNEGASSHSGHGTVGSVHSSTWIDDWADADSSPLVQRGQ
jgi:hypothetical protein